MRTISNPCLALGIRQACESVGLGRSKIYAEIAAGRLLSFRVGKRRLISADALTAWLDAHKTAA